MSKPCESEKENQKKQTIVDKAFLEHLKKAIEIFNSWPEWKKKIKYD